MIPIRPRLCILDARLDLIHVTCAALSDGDLSNPDPIGPAYVFVSMCMSGCQLMSLWHLIRNSERSRKDFQDPTVASCAVGQRLMPKDVS